MGFEDTVCVPMFVTPIVIAVFIQTKNSLF